MNLEWLTGAKTMQNDAATLYCPNDLCQAPNPQTHKFCQRCRTPLSKRYLWAVGAEIEAYKIGDILADRYLLKSHQIFLDTKPSLVPETPDSEIADAIKPYLRLVPYQLQVPQVYGLVPPWQGQTATEILLLEQAPIYPDGMPLEGQLMPELLGVWKEATSMRQLNWLWQIAQLWQPLSSEGVASSLLEPRLLRVEGSLMRLLECVEDHSCAPTLAELGQLWKAQLAVGARPAIAGFLEQLCLNLIQGKVRSSEQLVAILDQGLAKVGRSQTRTIQIVTCTDKGPSRQRNEDACYPPSGTTITKPPELEALGIVCDGIGGHEGGNVASNLAIETLQQQVQKMPLDDADLDATTLSTELERSTCAANDEISQRNDNEHRHGRQRMGTTLVMALARAHEIYMTHVGDSRAYWITRTGCHQVTLDDDVASRDVRLGLTLYRHALQQAFSGSLVQALGMSASLHPTVQRFVLDEDCVFLLCSDGLSDYDRVEQCWETEILPILDGKVDVVTASSRLVEIANTQNGHDNVTVGLVYCQVSSFEPESTISAEIAQQITVTDSAYPAAKATVVDTNNPGSPTNASPSTLQTQLLPSQPALRHSLMPVLLGITLLLSLCGGLLAYLFIPQVSGWVNRLISSNPSPSVAPEPTPSSPTSPVPNTAVPSLQVGTLIQIKNPILLHQTKGLATQPAIASPHQELFTPKGSVQADSVLKVLETKETVQQGYLLKLRVCSIPGTGDSDATKPELAQNDTQPSLQNVKPSPTTSDSNRANTSLPQLQLEEEGWIGRKTLMLGELKNLDPTEFGQCVKRGSRK